MFEKGDNVTVNTESQGLQKGKVYTVTHVHSVPTFAGSIVYYQLDGDLWVINGHLVLRKSETKKVESKK